ncbi:hypothetical protein ER308_05860 [Egibacter rhizosphaerae]|uniref:PPIase cyclophilin-type domain-containing protein n=1 Tax=Egibacter rhizosphaerae TaxID=1670831 RepID=A0A411YD01_9ACTN|nr:peptidylprolyl isomerase [Egibacter rhizosphaerae]QBI19111.1 hypothetical protein ER308_05860 [Egibacter rhizosphaerae]
MGTRKQQAKQTRRERRAAKEAAREEARRAERRQQRITLAVIAGILLLGGALIGFTIYEQRQEEAEARAEQEELLAEIEEQEEAVADRPVACGAEAPAGAGDEREPYDEAPPDVLDEGADYRATIETSCGELVIDLDAEAAPETVNAFVFLAEDGFYDGREVFRHDESLEVLQAGSPNDALDGDVGFELPSETARAEEEGYPSGSVALASFGGPDSGGSQFFLVYGEAFEELAGQQDELMFTNFGEVVDGREVLDEIVDLGAIGELLAPDGPAPAERVYIESVSVEGAD